jgi:arsenate reductase-like glutaredoxin family protein
MDLLNGKIKVYNYERSPIGFPSQINQKGVFVRGRDEDEEFVVERVLWDDVEIENTKSDIFKIGRLRFNPSEENEIYKKLGIEDKENIMNDTEIIQLLKNDSIENLKRIHKIKSSMLLSRMKQILFIMERGGQIPPHNVTTVLVEHIEELKSGRKNENSYINKVIEKEKKELEESHLKSTLNNLASEIESLKVEKEKADKEKEESKNALSDLLKMVQNLKAENEVLKKQDVNVENKEVTAKKVGRPKNS